MVDERQKRMAALKGVVPSSTPAPELLAAIAELGERDSRWAAALERAHRLIAQRLEATRHLRRRSARY
jgi:hypothetical protein